ncbi:hypothetical protein CO675_11475 [Bradyrhizobium sp. C9]|nr:hypothetical protein CO675_11475 [Bradyrhizobium sp. C9]
MTPAPTCKRCRGARWVCENHPDRPWSADTGCEYCGAGAGMICPDCNPADGFTHPILPPGFVEDDDSGIRN